MVCGPHCGRFQRSQQPRSGRCQAVPGPIRKDLLAFLVHQFRLLQAPQRTIQDALLQISVPAARPPVVIRSRPHLVQQPRVLGLTLRQCDKHVRYPFTVQQVLCVADVLSKNLVLCNGRGRAVAAVRLTLVKAITQRTSPAERPAALLAPEHPNPLASIQAVRGHVTGREHSW